MPAGGLGEGGAGRRRQHDLAAVRAVTDARRGVDRQADVAGLGERRPAAVDAPRGRARRRRPATGPSAIARCSSTAASSAPRASLEHREELVAARVDLVPARRADRSPQHAAHGRGE